MNVSVVPSAKRTRTERPPPSAARISRGGPAASSRPASMIATSVHTSSSSARMWLEMMIVLPIALS